MIYLTAIRASGGGFRYKIEAPDGSSTIAETAPSAAEALRALGVHEPQQLVAHAEEWGSVEIIDGGPDASAP